MPAHGGLRGSDVREVFEKVLPDDALRRIIDASRFQERERRLDALQFVRAMVIAAATGYGGRQADVMRLYFESGSPRVARGGFYAWFGPELEHTMKEVARLALDFGHAQPLDVPPLLGAHVRDWHIVDSETVKLPDVLKDEYPGTGDYAALKVHKRFSVGIGTLYDYHTSPAREHDAPHLTVDETWKGLGLLVDLGYASLKLIADCEKHDVRFVMRLKESWKPKVERILRGQITRTFFAGTDLDALIDDDVLVLGGQVVDAEVTLGHGRQKVRCRLVGVVAPDGSYRFYLTNLPVAVGPRQVADIYRVRWEVESDNKLDKSCHHLDEIRAQSGATTRALVHASMTGSMLACLLAHRHRINEAPPTRVGQERITPPIHPQMLARAMGSAAAKIAAAMLLTGQPAEKEWTNIAEHLEHLGKDPNWRSRPSILDQMRGWAITPGRSKVARLASKATSRAN
jgi:putative transposase